MKLFNKINKKQKDNSKYWVSTQYFILDEFINKLKNITHIFD